MTGKEPNIDFKTTKAYSAIRNFVFLIDNSIKTEQQLKPSTPVPFLAQIEEIIEKTPLSKKQARFSNYGMCDVIKGVAQLTEDPYLRESFGNATRTDYGTGHELNFLCFLYRLYLAREIKINEVSLVLGKYFQMIRKFLDKFNIEAAGARGFWSVDDYQLLPYLFGSSENMGKGTTHISQLNKGLFWEAWRHHGPCGMLDKLCCMPWNSINLKLLKMYESDVLGRHVVTQHFIYTEELPSEPEN